MVRKKSWEYSVSLELFSSTLRTILRKTRILLGQCETNITLLLAFYSMREKIGFYAEIQIIFGTVYTVQYCTGVNILSVNNII